MTHGKAKLRRPSQGALLTLFATPFATGIGVQALTLLTGMITTRMLGPAGRGVFAAAQIWLAAIALFALLAINHALRDSSTRCDTGYVRGRHGGEIRPPHA